MSTPPTKTLSEVWADAPEPDELDPVTAAIEREAAAACARMAAQTPQLDTGLLAAAHVGAHVAALRETVMLALTSTTGGRKPMLRAEREHAEAVEEVLGVTQSQLSREHSALIGALDTLARVVDQLAAAKHLDATPEVRLYLLQECHGLCVEALKQGRSLIAPVLDLVGHGG